MFSRERDFSEGYFGKSNVTKMFAIEPVSIIFPQKMQIFLRINSQVYEFKISGLFFF